jgi:hypothetical protein
LNRHERMRNTPLLRLCLALSTCTLEAAAPNPPKVRVVEGDGALNYVTSAALNLENRTEARLLGHGHAPPLCNAAPCTWPERVAYKFS